MQMQKRCVNSTNRSHFVLLFWMNECLEAISTSLTPHSNWMYTSSLKIYHSFKKKIHMQCNFKEIYCNCRSQINIPNSSSMIVYECSEVTEETMESSDLIYECCQFLTRWYTGCLLTLKNRRHQLHLPRLVVQQVDSHLCLPMNR